MQTIVWCDTYVHFCYHHNYKKRWSTMITWMIGGRRAGPRLRPTSLNAINTLSNIERVQAVDLFRPTSMYYTTTPTISYLGGIVASLVPIPNSPITIIRISTKIQQSITLTLVMGEIVVGLRIHPTLPSASTLVYWLIEEECLVSCDLDTIISKYLPLFWEEEWLVKFDLSPWPPKLLEVKWLISWDLCPQLSQPPRLIE